MDGIETVKIIRELQYKNPIVALTANALTGQAEMFLANGFNGFISKPVDIRQLDFWLNKLIRDKQPQEIIAAAWKQKTEPEEKENNKVVPNQVNPQLAEIFIKDAEKARTALETLLNNKFRRADDIHLYVISVHAMKSALANIGENDLSYFASKLEQAGREKNTETMLEKTPAFVNALSEVIEKISPKKGEKNEETVEDVSGDTLFYLREKILSIKEACKVFDKKAVKNSLDELKHKKWPPKATELLNNINEYLLHSDFDEAAKKCESFLE